MAFNHMVAAERNIISGHLLPFPAFPHLLCLSLPLPCELMDYKMLGVTLGLGENKGFQLPLPTSQRRPLDEVLKVMGAISGHSHQGLEKT